MADTPQEPVRIVLLGPPGAGKGTQAELLADRFSVPHIDTGALLREEIACNTALGQRVAAALRAGQLAPADAVIDAVGSRLARPDADAGFILDGFPRSAEQVLALDDLLAKRSQPLTAVVVLAVPDRKARARLLNRLVCPDCDATFSVRTNPPMAGQTCPQCRSTIRQVQGGLACSACVRPIQRREDDNPQAIDQRLRAYRSETIPVIEHYRRVGLAREVDGESSVEEVFSRILKAITRRL